MSLIGLEFKLQKFSNDCFALLVEEQSLALPESANCLRTKLSVLTDLPSVLMILLSQYKDP